MVAEPRHLFHAACPDLLDPPDPTRHKARKRSVRGRTDTQRREWHATDPVVLQIHTFGIHPEQHPAFGVRGHKGFNPQRLKRCTYRELAVMIRGLTICTMTAVHDVATDDSAIDDVKFCLVKFQLLLGEAIRRARPRGADREIACTSHYLLADPFNNASLDQSVLAGDLETPSHDRPRESD